MKCFLSTLLLLSLSSASYASDKTYNWILKQYASNNMPGVSAHTAGKIHGVPYVAIVTNGMSPNHDYDSTTEILIFRKIKERLSAIATIDLQGDQVDGYIVTIKNDSIYLETSGAHHGVFGTRYQFKQIGNKFKLIGGESHSSVSGCYAGVDEDHCGKYDFISGVSYNFLTSSAVCWQTKISGEQKFAGAMKMFNMFLRPKSAVIHQMKFRPVDLHLLDGFNFLKFSAPNTCYFDVKNKLQIERATR